MADEVDRVNLELEREEQRREQERAITQASRIPNNVTECEECGDDIPPARKQFDPSTKLCVECAGYHEKMGKHKVKR